MSSILTNNGAMVALQTMRQINQNLATTQNQISTGMRVGSAKDNAATWAISKTMESDVAGFRAIKESLALGSSTVNVARNAAETTTRLLTEVKEKIVLSQEQNVDREKIQEDIRQLRDQIQSVVGAAQFNGLNLLSNREAEAGTGTVNVLSSLDRSGEGTVSDSQIGVRKMDLGQQASSVGGTATAAGPALAERLTGAAAGAPAVLTGNATAPTSVANIVAGGVEAGEGYSIVLSAGAGGFAAGNTGGANDIRYVARDGDTAQDVARGLVEAFNRYASENDLEGLSAAVTGAAGTTITFTGSTVTGNNISVQVNHHAAAANTIGGGLERLAEVNVTTDEGAATALAEIEGMIQTAIAAASEFGQAQKRIDIQNDFVGSLMDTLRTGIGSLVDADMEEASARLQALQVQQQLGIQALSIANQQPQNILALFR